MRTTKLSNAGLFPARIAALSVAALTLAVGVLVVFGSGASAQEPEERSPFVDVVLPARVEAENFDRGPAGVAYSETDGPSGNRRTDTDVDVWQIDEQWAGASGALVGRTRDGEFLEYTVAVEAEDTFDVRVSLASGAAEPGVIHVDIDSVRLGTVSGDTDRWFDWTARDAGTTTLSAGEHVVRLTWADGANVNLDWFDFVAVGDREPTCETGAQEAEDAEVAGRFGVVEDDLASGGAYVDVPRGTFGWLNGVSSSYVDFCFGVPEAGTYRIEALLSAPTTLDNSFYVEVDQGPLVDFVTPVVLDFAEIRVNDAAALDPVQPGDEDEPIIDPMTWDLEAGDHNVRFYLRRDGTKLDRVALVRTDGEPAIGALEIDVDTLADGDVVDVSPEGAVDELATGSFDIGGDAGRDVASITVSVEGQSADAEIVDGRWVREVVPAATGTFDFLVEAFDAAGNPVDSETISLDVTAADADDTLYTPGFVDAELETPTAIDYRPDQNQLVFAGDQTGVIEPGMVLSSFPTDFAPDGYLRIAETIEFIGGETIVTGPAGGIVDVFRQFDFEDIMSTDPSLDDQVGAQAVDGLAPADADGFAARPDEGEDKPVFDEIPPNAPTFSVTATDGASASFTLGAGVEVATTAHLDVDWCRGWFCSDGPQVEYFNFEAAATAYAEARFEALAEAGVFASRDLFDVQIGQFWFGPVYMTVELEATAVASAEFNAEFNAWAQWRKTIIGGYEYRRDGSGRDVYSANPPGQTGYGISGSARFTAEAGLDFAIQFKLYDIAGPEVVVGPGLGFEAEIGAEFIDEEEVEANVFLNLEAYAFIQLSVGLNVEIWGPIDEVISIDPVPLLNPRPQYSIWSKRWEWVYDACAADDDEDNENDEIEAAGLPLPEGNEENCEDLLQAIVDRLANETQVGPNDALRLSDEQRMSAAESCIAQAELSGEDPRARCVEGQVFYSAYLNQGLITAHIAEAIDPYPQWAVLTFQPREDSRDDWYYDAELGGTCLRAPGSGDNCDEYPFFSSDKGYRLGQNPVPSTRMLPGSQNKSHGGSIGSFINQCPGVAGLRGGVAQQSYLMVITDIEQFADSKSFWTCQQRGDGFYRGVRFSVELTDDRPDPTEGATATLTVEARNVKPGTAAAGIYFDVPLPVGVSMPEPEEGYTCIGEIGRYRCSLPEETAPNISDTFEISYTVCDPGNLAADCSTGFEPADLRLSVERIPAEGVEAGGTITLRHTLRNAGPQVATNVMAKTTLPAGVADIQFPDTCSLDGLVVTCPWPSIEVDAQEQWDIVALVDPGADPTTMRANASAEADQDDPSRATASVLFKPSFPDDDECAACEQPDPPSIEPGQASTFSHPNLVTFDGRRFIFHGAGDYVLAESTVDDFEVQVRFSRMNSSTVSFNRAIAASVGDSIVSFGDDAESMAWDTAIVRLDGITIDPSAGSIDLPGGATIAVIDGMNQVDWPDGSFLRVGLRVADPWNFYVGEDRWGEVQGLLGDANGDRNDDLFARNGEDFDYNNLELYEIFGTSWLLDAETTLFESELNPIDRLPIIPSAIITLADLPPDAVAEADALCRAAGVMDGAGLAECVFDVALTGDTRWISGIEQVDEIVEESISVLAEQGNIEDDVTLTETGIFGGAIDRPAGTDLYRLNLEAGDSIVIRASNDCPNRSTFEFTLEAPGGYFIGRSTGSDCGRIGLADLPESGEYMLRVYDTSGYTGAYGFRVVLPATDGTNYDLDDVVDDSLDDAADEDYFVFDVPAGISQVFVDFQSCYATNQPNWDLTDAAGNVRGGDSCRDQLVPVIPGRHTLRTFTDRGLAGAYRFRIWAVPEAANFDLELEDVVTEGTIGDVAAPGAGSNESPGAQDTYNLTIPDGVTRIFVDFQQCYTSLLWELDGPDASNVRNSCRDQLRDVEPGDYTISVRSRNENFGTYSFRIWAVPEPENFTIDLNDVVSAGTIGGVPAAGAGDNESPGAVDIYTLTIPDGIDEVFVDFQECSALLDPRWELADATGNLVSSRNESCADRFLDVAAGEYTLSARSVTQEFGEYQFRVWTIPEPESFDLGIGETVSDGTIGGVAAVGAGNNESPGAEDIYALTIPAGVNRIFVDFEDCYSVLDPRWDLTDAAGNVVSLPLFGGDFCTDRFLDIAPGDHTLSIRSTSQNFGAYSFTITEVAEPQNFTVELDDLVVEGAIGGESAPGAGWNEAPGAEDRYALTIPDGVTRVFVDFQGCYAILDPRWELVDAAGVIVGQASNVCTDRFVDVTPGEHTLNIRSTNENFGTYAFEVSVVPEPQSFSIGLDQLVFEGSIGGAIGVGVGWIESPGAQDIYTFTVPDGVDQILVDFQDCYAILDPRWDLADAAGNIIGLTSDVCTDRVLDVTPGEYTLNVRSTNSNSGTYIFVITEAPSG